MKTLEEILGALARRVEKLERAEKFADNIIFEDICELVESRYIPAHKAK